MSTNPLHRLLRGTASAAALLALALLAQGCVADNEDDCPAISRAARSPALNHALSSSPQTRHSWELLMRTILTCSTSRSCF